jgi:hypothetical protein
LNNVRFISQSPSIQRLLGSRIRATHREKTTPNGHRFQIKCRKLLEPIKMWCRGQGRGYALLRTNMYAATVKITPAKR